MGRRLANGVVAIVLLHAVVQSTADFDRVPHRPLIKLSLTRKPSPWPWHCVCNSFGGQNNYKGETRLSPMTHKPSSSPKYQHDPGLGLHARARGHAAA